MLEAFADGWDSSAAVIVLRTGAVELVSVLMLTLVLALAINQRQTRGAQLKLLSW